MKAHEFIKKQIEEGMTQTSFARKCKISQAFVNNVMQGHTKIQEHIVHKIAHAYGLPLSYFLEESTLNKGFSELTPQELEMVQPEIEAFIPALQNLLDRGQQDIINYLTGDIAAIVTMLKDDPDLARRVRRFTEFEQGEEKGDDLMRNKAA